MARKTKHDWLMEGLAILQAKGFEGLTIDELTTRLGVTKGSFYHHFKDYEGFKVALLDFYEHEGTLHIIEKVEAEPNASAKLKRLFEIILKYDTTVEAIIRARGLTDALVQSYQERIDAQREGYVQGLCRQIVQDDDLAEHIAEFFYVALVGGEQKSRRASPDRMRRVYDDINRLYHLW